MPSTIIIKQENSQFLKIYKMFELKKDINHNTTVYFEDGDCLEVYANQLHNKNLDYWEGWQCSAGMNRIMIDDKNNVWSGECENDFLGNLDDKSFVLFKEFTTCKRERCTGCTDDLIIEKFKP